MERRTFLALTGTVLHAAPLVAEAQPAGKVHRVGILSTANPAPRPSSKPSSKDCTSWAMSKGRTLDAIVHLVRNDDGAGPADSVENDTRSTPPSTKPEDTV